MSALILQRLVVRMLHDPGFRAEVYADPDEALVHLPLSAEQRRLLVRPDARAWGADADRTDRVLTALLDELPVSALVLLEDGLSLEVLYAFFQSRHFHDAIMARASLAPAFAAYLATLAQHPRARAIVALEAAIAAVRRARAADAAPPDHLRCRPGVLAMAQPGGTLAAWHAAKQALGATPAVAIFGSRVPRMAPIDLSATEWILLERQDAGGLGEASAGFIGEALGRLLQAAARPVPRAQLLAMCVAEGADSDEAAEIIDDLIRDALLV